ncbi:MAG: nitroreductase family protein [Bacteroidales bacterium]|nr:nitroreductase family protein [Bacteroidales bacterium]
MKRISRIIILAIITLSVVSCQNETTGPNKDNEVIKTIMARRSVRQYKDTPIDHETMDLILKCGINAPSGTNAQPWEIRVVDNQELLAEMSEKMLAEFDDSRMAQVKSLPGYRNMFRNATTVVFIANNGNLGRLDCGLLGENMILAAQSLGIGSCCLGGPINFFRTDAGKPYLDKLNFSADYTLLYAIGFGYPDESPEAKPRDESKIKYIE